MASPLKLHGDGVRDDTAAIQALLDQRRSCVCLPPPEKHYTISRPLVIHSGQELRLDRWTVIRLAPGSSCFMLTNDDHDGGNQRIAVTGGVWDFANLDQGPNFMLHEWVTPRPTSGGLPESDDYDPGLYRGVAFYFMNVSHFALRSLTVRNPVTYAIQCCRLSDFVIDDVEFDFTTWNPVQANMDGVHLDGGCHHGRISNLRGTCYDDLVALNANDGCCAAYQGPINDIDIDGIYADYCHSAVRLLSTGAPLKRVSIRNIHGNFYRYMVGITHFFPKRPSRGVFDDLFIENCCCGKALQPGEMPFRLAPFPLVLIEGKTDVGKLYLGNLHREEFHDPQPFIGFSVAGDTPAAEPGFIGWLTIENCSMVNHLPEQLDFFRCLGRIGRLEMRNNRLESAPGAGPCLEFNAAAER